MIELEINGKPVQLDVADDMPLLWALRDHVELTGTKFGCGIAQCGACTVHIDGKPARSCVTPVSSVAGRRVTTIEGLSADAEDEVAKAVQSAWVEIEVPQCGYCQSGQIMSAVGLLREKREPTDAEIETAMAGNVCRCATYVRIRKAIRRASQALA